MSLFLKNNNFKDIYFDILNHLLNSGEIQGKSKGDTGLYFELLDPRKSMIPISKNWAWTLIEGIDRLSKDSFDNNPGNAHPFRPAWAKKLKNEGAKEFCYSYGDCFSKQLPFVLKMLKKRGQREAIINVWNSSHLIQNIPRRPCTLTLHFIVNNSGKLDLFVNMRTNDSVNLLYSDVFHHTLLQKYVATELGLELGSYFHNCSYFYYQKKRDITGSLVNTMKRLKKAKDINYSVDFNIDSSNVLSLSNLIKRLINNDYDHHKLYEEIKKSQFSLMYGLSLIYAFLIKYDKKNNKINGFNKISMKEFDIIKLKRGE